MRSSETPRHPTFEKAQRFLAPGGRGAILGDFLARFVGQIPRVPFGRLTDITAGQVQEYYKESQSYLTGPLQGTCHFGFTQEGQPFEMRTALHNMEVLLGEALNLPQGATVVDAGCGYGRVATRMASEFDLNVIGVDITPERVVEARRYAQEYGVSDKVRIIEGNYSQLPLPDNSVDAVYTMETLVHAENLEATWREFMRVLKPGGKVAHFEYSVPPHESLDPIRRKITDTMVNNTGMTSIGRFTHDAFPTLLEKAGFENINVREVSRNVWPHWRWQFYYAIKENGLSIVPKILNGTLTDTPNLAGSLMIWSYRHQLGYNIVTATKPNPYS